jgi:hypothetical protein
MSVKLSSAIKQRGDLFMSESSIKKNKRALRRAARDEKNNIVSQYMTDNWDKVLMSSVSLIRTFKFKNRLQIAMTILFRPTKRQKSKAEAK